MAYDKETRKNKYPYVDQLPKKGVYSVPEYAALIGSQTSYVYQLHKEDKLINKGVQIVIFHGYNFVIPA